MTQERLNELAHPSNDQRLFMEAFAEEVTGRPVVPGKKSLDFSNCLACRALDVADPTKIHVPHTCGKELALKVGEVQKTRQPNKAEVHLMNLYAKCYKKRNPRSSLADVTKAVAKKFNIQVIE